MGGRLDSTNVITPLVSVITNIGLDHTQFLGDTLAKIATEKAGIIKSNVPVVIGEFVSETKSVFELVAEKSNAPIYFAQELPEVTHESDLLGFYQRHNKKTVLQTVQLLEPFFIISEAHIVEGLKNVMKNTGLLGRWQTLQTHPKVICDTAHNSHGLKIVMDQLQNESFDQLFIVLGVVNDKDLDAVLPLFPKNANYFFCKPNVPRGLEARILQEKAKEFCLFGKVFNSVSEAYDFALQTAKPNDLIYVGGSTFVVAEIV